MTSPRSQRARNRSRVAAKAFTPSTSPESLSMRKEAAKKRGPSLRMVNWGEMVNIRCVDNQDLEQHFVVHKCFVTHHSAYYDRAFNSRFLEGQTQSTDEFPISVEAFSMFVKWLYTQTVKDSKGGTPSVKELINLWILANEKLVPALQNQVIMVLNDEFGKMEELPTELFSHVYEHTGEDGQLRKCFVDMCVGQLAKVEVGNHFPREMLVDLLKAGAESKSSKATKLSKDKVKNYFVPEDVPGRRSGSTILESNSSVVTL